ncbi:MAG: sufR [Modestobacter sp.]|nr:sufR [Modestobacter sp.]
METTTARAVPPAAGAPAEDGRTRDRVGGLLLEHGPQTATELAARLGVSPAAVRRHLDGLVAAGRVTEREAPGTHRGRGRPARHFALTDAGRSAFPHAYDDLALTALRFVAEHGGPDAVRAVAEQQLAGLAERCSTAVDSAVELAAQEGAGATVDRAQVLAAALTAEGYAATASAISSGGQLCQHHCPVAHVAAEFPQLCEAETAVISKLVGTHVQRLATIAHGDGICTTHIPAQLALRAGNGAGNKAIPARPVPAGRATASEHMDRSAGASTRTTPSIDRERTPA